MKDTILTVLVALVVSLGVTTLFAPEANLNVGSVASPEIYEDLTFGDGATAKKFTQGGSIQSISTTSATYTLAQSDLEDYAVIRFTPLGANATLTLPATSTFSTLLQSPGDTRSWVIENAATAATTTTIAAGTGIDLQEPDGQNVVISNDNYAWLTCFREATTNVVCNVNETIPAD